MQREHGANNVAEMYTPSADVAATMEGTAPALLDGLAERLGDLAMLVRAPTMKAINLLKASEANTDAAAAQRIVMTGSAGQVPPAPRTPYLPLNPLYLLFPFSKLFFFPRPFRPCTGRASRLGCFIAWIMLRRQGGL